MCHRRPELVLEQLIHRCEVDIAGVAEAYFPAVMRDHVDGGHDPVAAHATVDVFDLWPRENDGAAAEHALLHHTRIGDVGDRVADERDQHQEGTHSDHERHHRHDDGGHRLAGAHGRAVAQQPQHTRQPPAVDGQYEYATDRDHEQAHRPDGHRHLVQHVRRHQLSRRTTLLATRATYAWVRTARVSCITGTFRETWILRPAAGSAGVAQAQMCRLAGAPQLTLQCRIAAGG